MSKHERAPCSEDGLIITLSREQGEGRYTVFLDDGRSLPARLLVDSRRNGLRLLKIEAGELPFISLADAETEVGDSVFATFATDHRRRAAAQGIIAAESAGSLHLDLAAGRMSTGGPLVDGEGRLVGILSGKQALNPGEDQCNFALSVEAAGALLKARNGEDTAVVHRGRLGVSLQVKKEDGRERIIMRPLPDSPAAAGGMRDGDELLAINGEMVVSDSEAVAAVARHAPGDKIVLTVRRDGEQRKLEIIVGPLPETPESADQPPPAGTAPPAVVAPPARGGLPPAGASLVRPGHQAYVTIGEKQVMPPAGANLVRPGHYRIQTPDGKLVAIHAGPIPNIEAGPVPNTIRVERSDLEKKLEEVSRNVESLQQEMRKLTEEIKSLRAKSGQQK